MGSLVNLEGQHFGRWTVLERAGSAPKHGAMWLCKCDCGKESVVRGDGLLNGRSKSCGCLAAQKTAEMSKNRKSYSRKLIDITGRTFDRLTVIKRAPKQGSPDVVWLCRCTCGKETIVQSSGLRLGEIRSCGCLGIEKSTTHGKSYLRECGIWHGMKRRCYDPASIGYKWYGNRGIQVCQHWKEDFMNFLNDVGERPSKQHSIDRINNDMHYSCGHCAQCQENHWQANCRWADRKTQANNRRTSKKKSPQCCNTEATQTNVNQRTGE